MGYKYPKRKGIRLNRNQWLIDIGLIVVIIVMAVFVIIELNRTYDFMRQSSDDKPTQTALLPIQVDAPMAVGNVSVDDFNHPQIEPFQLLNLEGERVALSDYKGRPVLINFWATWCPPCLAEMPLIQTFAEKYAGDLVVLAINVGEEEGLVRQYIDQHELDLNFLLDPSNSAAAKFNVYGFPTTLFMDQDGELLARHIGELNEPLLVMYLEKIGIQE